MGLHYSSDTLTIRWKMNEDIVTSMTSNFLTSKEQDLADTSGRVREYQVSYVENVPIDQRDKMVYLLESITSSQHSWKHMSSLLHLQSIY